MMNLATRGSALGVAPGRMGCGHLCGVLRSSRGNNKGQGPEASERWKGEKWGSSATMGVWGGCMCYDRKVTQARARSHRAWGAETRDLNFILRKLKSH